MIDMSKKVVFITGSAKGLGKELARKFGYAGASVFIVDIDAENSEATTNEFKNLGIQALFCAVDLCNEHDIKKAVSSCISNFGSLDVLINCARPQLKVQSFIESMSEWDLAMSIFLKSPALIIAMALPELSKSGKGSFINISSTNAVQISHQPLSYHVAKAGLLQMTRYLANELGPQGIRVNAICPSLIDRLEENANSKNQSFKQLIAETIIPLGRIAHPNEIADLALFLASDMATYINGQAIIIDGGMSNGCQYHSAISALNKFIE
jgi:glucose 1-dehydrogenase